MAHSELVQLLKMAEQIALNLGAGHEQPAAELTAAHIQRFWTPAMRNQLIEFWREGGDVSTAVAGALQQLEQQVNNGEN